MGRKVIDLVGKQFGRLTVISRGENSDDGVQPRWNCECSCGGTSLSAGLNLRSGRTKSCGCIQRETASRSSGSVKGWVKDGRSKHPLYHTYSGMKNRCKPGNANAYSHGEKGVRVCDRWINDFWSFVADVGPKPSPKMSLDRIDGNGHYEPTNVRWATQSVQIQNSSLTKISKEQVRGIFRMRDTGVLHREIAAHYSISLSQVSNILAGRKHPEIFAEMRG